AECKTGGYKNDDQTFDGINNGYRNTNCPLHNICPAFQPCHEGRSNNGSQCISICKKCDDHAIISIAVTTHATETMFESDHFKGSSQPSKCPTNNHGINDMFSN